MVHAAAKVIQITAAQLAPKVAKYVTEFVKTVEGAVPKRRFFRSNPVAGRLARFWQEERQLSRELTALVRQGESTAHQVFDAAVKASNTHDAGLVMGYLDTVTKCAVGSAKFQEGFQIGQVLRLNLKSAWHRFLHGASMMGVATSAISISEDRARGIYTQHPLFPIYSALQSSLIPAALGFSFYGMHVMRATRLFANDAALPAKLVTSGAFRFHRNPFYVAMAIPTIMGVATIVIEDTISDNPHPAVATLLTISALVFMGCFHLNALRDERMLTRLFGAAYETYKKTTPRYFPAIWKLL